MGATAEAPKRSPSAGAAAAGGGPGAAGTPKPKASKKRKPVAEPEPEDASLSTETLLKYYEDKRRVVRFDQLRWDKKCEHGQCRGIDESLVDECYTFLPQNNAPLQPYAGGLGWMMDGVLASPTDCSKKT